MSGGEQRTEEYRTSRVSGSGWVKWVSVGVLILIGAGLVLREYRASQVVGHSQYRFNMAVITPEIGITFVSFDPTERAILALPFPANLAIKSRTSGEYSIASLYKLGSYSDEGGKFARQKIQGFMRVPVPGYLVVNKEGKIKRGLWSVVWGRAESSLSKLDALALLYRMSKYSQREIGEDELIRASVIDKNTYYPERLQEYIGTRLFDWGIGRAETSVAVLNESGEDGLGSDMADFLSNLGLDVVMVRSSDKDEKLVKSEWQVGSKEGAEELTYIFENLFGFDKPKIEPVDGQYRSTVVIRVGKDAKELF